MKRTLILVLSVLSVTAQAQVIEKNPSVGTKDSTELRLNQEALQTLQRSFESLPPVTPVIPYDLKPFPQGFPETGTQQIFHCPTSLLSNPYMGLPLYEQTRMGRFLLQAQTSYGGSPYVLQKQLALHFSLNDRTAFYLKGSFDWIRQRPVYMSGAIQPVNLRAGLSFLLKGGQTIDLGIKCQYTAGEKQLEVYRQWDTVAECSLHF